MKSQGTNDTILSDFEVVNLTVSNDKATSVTITIEDLTAASSTVNVSGPDNLTLTGTHEIGTLNAASLAGVLTMTVSAASDNITGGSGADVFTMTDVDLVLNAVAVMILLPWTQPSIVRITPFPFQALK